MKRYVEHDECYGNGCVGCLYRGFTENDEWIDCYSDYIYDINSEEDELA